MVSYHVPTWLVRRLREHDRIRVATTARDSVRLGVRGGRAVSYCVMPAARLTDSEAERLAAELAGRRPAGGARPLLAVDVLSEAARARLRRADVSWVERDTGVEYITGPGLHVERALPTRNTPTAASPAVSRAVRLSARSGVIGEVLLEWPEDRPVTLGPLAQDAAVSKVLASRVLRRLVDERVLSAVGKAPHRSWRLTDRDKLLDLWTAEEDQRRVVVTPMYLWVPTPDALYQRFKRLDQERWAWALAGVAAANAYAPHLTVLPDPTVWGDAAVPAKDIAQVLGAEVVPDGANMAVWQADKNAALTRARVMDRRGPADGLRIVSPPRAVVEAAAAPGRGRDVAEHLRRQLPTLRRIP